ncbi:MAG: hypothetical protein CMF69_06380 [Magnetovibrio sp.]|nr:hypothetical protein [Magnetovibrio sp.]|tara:strand:- start:486 stop:860 length:375 start_codon:yes stop_codon:yes gene_type:complete
MVKDFSQSYKPIEIRLHRDEKVLEIDFDNGRSFRYSAEFLRVESPSAEVQGHGPGQKQLVSGRRHVGIMDVTPVGNYAVCIKFDDLHDSGIFAWDTLYQYGEHQEKIWADYLAALEQAGLCRDP